jgi:membrane protease YdiL (CAAX protease family)
MNLNPGIVKGRSQEIPGRVVANHIAALMEHSYGDVVRGTPALVPRGPLTLIVGTCHAAGTAHPEGVEMALIDRDNPMFDMAREGKRLPGVFLALLVLVGVVGLAFVIPAIWAQIVYGESGQAEAFFESASFLLISFSLMLLFLWVWVAAYERRSVRTLGFPTQSWCRKLLVGLLLGFGMVALAVGLMSVAGAIAVDDAGTQQSGGAALGGAMLLLLVFGVQGGAEEVIFRGWLLGVLGARYRPWVGVAISTVVFVVVHGTARPLAVLNLVLFALFLSLYCLKEGSIWGICGWHAAWNWTQGHFFGLEITGHSQAGGTVLDLKAVGPELLSGGGYGVEATIMCTLVLGAGVAVMIAALRRQELERHRALEP